MRLDIRSIFTHISQSPQTFMSSARRRCDRGPLAARDTALALEIVFHSIMYREHSSRPLDTKSADQCSRSSPSVWSVAGLDDGTLSVDHPGLAIGQADARFCVEPVDQRGQQQRVREVVGLGEPDVFAAALRRPRFHCLNVLAGVRLVEERSDPRVRRARCDSKTARLLLGEQ